MAGRNFRTLRGNFSGGEMSPEMFGRVDDVRFQHGAASLQNLLVTPQGPLRRRPGTSYVATIKDSAGSARLIPFAFSTADALVIEMGVTSAGAGYFRFHQDGAPVTYTTPSAYIADALVVRANDTNEQFQTSAAHGFSTGDPVVLTLAPGDFCNTITGTNNIQRSNWRNDFAVGCQCVFGGSLPAELVAGRTYYVVTDVDATKFQVSETRGGTPVGPFTSSASSLMGALPAATADDGSATEVFLETGRTYYVNKVSNTQIRLCESQAKALAGTYYYLSTDATANSVTFHYRYELGDLVAFSGSNYYCRTLPWEDYLLSHPPEDGGNYYWHQLPTSPNVYEVPHDYAASILFEVTYAQSNDVLTLAHRDRPLTELRRYGTTDWRLETVSYIADVGVPQNCVATGTGGRGNRVSSIRVRSSGLWQLAVALDESAWLKGDTVYVEGISNVGGDGYYQLGDIVQGTSGGSGLVNQFRLQELESNMPVDATQGPTTYSATVYTSLPETARVRNMSLERAWDGEDAYVVTAIDEGGVESAASNQATSTVNLYATGAKNVISWDAVTDAQVYRVYKRQSGLFGFIGEVSADETLEFTDDNISPDLSISPPRLDGNLLMSSTVTFDSGDDTITWTDHELSDGMPVVFDATQQVPTGITRWKTYYVINSGPSSFQISATRGGAAVNFSTTGIGTQTAYSGYWPGAVAYFEQRRVLSGSWNLPQDVWMTASGTEADLSYSLPTKDSDRIQFRIASRELGIVQHAVPLSHLLLLTNSAEYRVTPINDDALTPSSISVRPQSYVGADVSQPVVVNNNVVFAAYRGGHMRELGFSQDVSGYLTGDLSLRAAHLFDGKTISQIAYSKAPVPIVWCVSSGGDMLAITYIPEESIGAWHHHTTDGSFESVAVIPEGVEDRVYVVVKRTVNGATVRYVERMDVQDVDALEDCVYLDSAVTQTGDVSTVTLSHLEGKTVYALVDGVVQGPFTVSGGSITLTTAGTSKTTAGLAYTAQLQTLPVLMQVEAFGQAYMKNVNRVKVRVAESGAFKIGPDTATLSPSRLPVSGGLLTGTEDIIIGASWTDDGQVVLQQTDPLPLTVVSLAFEVAVGG